MKWPRYRIWTMILILLGMALLLFRMWSDPNRVQPDTQAAGDTQRALTTVSLPTRATSDSIVGEIAGLSEPQSDSWDSEALAEELSGQLKTLAKFIEGADQDGLSLDAIVSNDFLSGRLLPKNLVIRYQRAGLTVRSGAVDESPSATSVDREGLGDSLRQLGLGLGRKATVRVKFKLFQIQTNDERVSARAYYEGVGRDGGRSVQQNATWNCQWRRLGKERDAIRLTRIDLEQFEQTENTTGEGRLFEDCTKSVLARNSSYQGQIIPGIPHWSKRIGREFMTQFGHHGLAVGDVNGDGLDDLYMCDAGGLPNRLFVQQEDGTARDVSAGSGVNLLEDSVSALLIDLDNDGDQDLVIATDPLIHFGENDGSGKFTLHQGYYANTDSYSMCASDYDSDGDLDIYVCGYNVRKQDPVNRGLPFPLPYHDANNGGRNYLLRNDGSFRFTDVTEAVGLDEQNSRFSLAAAWEDFDNDGDMDLYVANDFGRNCLYRNDGGSFHNLAAAAGVEDHASGMSVAWGDYDRDGWLDLYVSNMFSAAGNRVTYQRRFGEGLTDDTVAHLRRMSRGNTLFRSRGDGTFQDVSESAAVTMGRWAWASRFADLNNDGWLDLMVANGYVTNDDTSDL